MSVPKILLYDTPNRSGEPWSYNPLKTRLVLNYKNIPFETKWLEFPDIEPTLKEAGVKPNEAGIPYTVPTIKIIGTGEHIMDSRKIADALEASFPPADLHLDSSVLPKVHELEIGCTGPLNATVMPRVQGRIVNPRTSEYLYENVSKKLGMPLDEWCEANGGEQNWIDAKPAWMEVAALLKENKEGPFFMGAEVSYADFYVIALLHCSKHMGQDMFDRLVGFDDALLALYEAGKQWL